MRIDLKQLAALGFDVDTGLKYTGNPDNYLYMIQRYYTNARKMADTISDSLVANDIVSFTRAVHSLKSNSKMIGAVDFAALAEELEHMARSADMSGMLDKTPVLLEQLSQLLKRIEPYAKMEVIVPEGTLSADEALKVGAEVLKALEELDDRKATELTKKLMGYPFRPRLRSILKSVLDDIADYNYDDATAQVVEVLREVDN